MKLELDRIDLKEEYSTQFTRINCSQTRFEHFKEDVQKAIKSVGHATFYEFDRRNYNVVYPEEELAAEERAATATWESLGSVGHEPD